MSNPFKAVGKVFKKVVHSTVGKIVIGALMVGAVVLTAGAALGALPAIGSVLGSVGISGTMASILGGAISMGAVGAVTGGVGGLISGKGFFSGATTGFLAGAATGGILGGVGAIGANGIFGTMGQAAAIPAPDVVAPAGVNLATDSLVPGASGTALAGTAASAASAAAPTAVAGSTTAAASSAGAAQAAGHGILGSGGLLGTGGIGPILQAGGSILSGFASGKGTQAQIDAELQMQRTKFDQSAFNYGYRNIYGDKSGVPTSQEQVYAMSPTSFASPSSSNPGGLLRTAPSPFITPAVTYQIVNGQVVAVPSATG